ncbi:MAG: hypothetical protein WAU05_02030 [Nitrospira sp.]
MAQASKGGKSAKAESNVAPVTQQGEVFMKSQAIICATLAAAMLSPVGFVTIGSAQDLDRDRDQLKTQQQLQDKDKLQTKDQLHKELKDKDQLKEQERTRERERAREHMQTERPEKPQHERSERGGGGGRH